MKAKVLNFARTIKGNYTIVACIITYHLYYSGKTKMRFYFDANTGIKINTF